MLQENISPKSTFAKGTLLQNKKPVQCSGKIALFPFLKDDKKKKNARTVQTMKTALFLPTHSGQSK